MHAGTLPGAFRTLPFEYLKVHANGFTGRIPEEWRQNQWDNLTQLLMYEDQLTGRRIQAAHQLS